MSRRHDTDVQYALLICILSASGKCSPHAYTHYTLYVYTYVLYVHYGVFDSVSNVTANRKQ